MSVPATTITAVNNAIIAAIDSQTTITEFLTFLQANVTASTADFFTPSTFNIPLSTLFVGHNIFGGIPTNLPDITSVSIKNLLPVWLKLFGDYTPNSLNYLPRIYTGITKTDKNIFDVLTQYYSDGSPTTISN